MSSGAIYVGRGEGHRDLQRLSHLVSDLIHEGQLRLGDGLWGQHEGGIAGVHPCVLDVLRHGVQQLRKAGRKVGKGGA